VNESPGPSDEHHDVHARQGEALWELLCDVSADVSGPTDDRLRTHISEGLARWVEIQNAAAVALVRRSAPRNLLVAGWQRRDLTGDLLVALTEPELDHPSEASYCAARPLPAEAGLPPLGCYEVPVGAGGVALRAYVDERPPVEHDAVHRVFAELVAGALHRTGIEERLRVTAMKDPVTGLANRRLLVDHIERRLAAMERRTYEQMIVVSIEAQLHAPGRENHPSSARLDPEIVDEVELVVSRRLRAAVRRSDLVAVVAPHVFVAAIELAPGDDLLVPVERLRRAVCEPVAVRSTTFPVNVR
jgi:GGDEF domain-containing protein